jgi:hypothetical protein
MVLMTTEPNVILRGGPNVGLADDERLWYVPEPVDKIKVPRGHRYEHFERSADTWTRPGGATLQVFVWTGFTRVAE